jgi:Helicase associated domain
MLSALPSRLVSSHRKLPGSSEFRSLTCGRRWGVMRRSGEEYVVTRRELPSCAAMTENAKSSTRLRREIAWEKGFAALKQFNTREGHCRVPRGHQEGSFELGTWVVNQRNRRDALSVERRRRLDAIRFVWAFHGNPWENCFSALKGFKAREGHSLVPNEDREGTFNLGKWVARQRIKKDTLPVERRRRLESLRFVWDPFEFAWERGFAALKQFKVCEKHCRVPRAHEKGSFKLGTWVVNQRNRKDALSVERRRKLDSIGFIWRLT